MRLAKVPHHLLILLVALMLSGCASTPPKSDCAGATCTPVPLDFLNDVTKVVRFEECEGGIGLASVPMEKAQAVVPNEFDVAYGLGAVPRVAGVHTMGVTCSRVVVNSTVLANVSWFRTGVFVSPKNESWRGNGVNRYLLDSWFSAPELVEWFKSAGIPAEAATFRREAIPAGSAPRTEEWSVEGSTCDLSAEFNVSGQTLPPADDVFFHWVGPKPYQRVELFEGWLMDAHHISASPFTIEGKCASERALDGIPAQGTQYNPRYNATMTITGKTFS